MAALLPAAARAGACGSARTRAPAEAKASKDTHSREAARRAKADKPDLLRFLFNIYCAFLKKEKNKPKGLFFSQLIIFV